MRTHKYTYIYICICVYSLADFLKYEMSLAQIWPVYNKALWKRDAFILQICPALLVVANLPYTKSLVQIRPMQIDFIAKETYFVVANVPYTILFGKFVLHMYTKSLVQIPYTNGALCKRDAFILFKCALHNWFVQNMPYTYTQSLVSKFALFK